MPEPPPSPVLDFALDREALLAACARLLGTRAELRVVSDAKLPVSLLHAWLRAPLIAALLEDEADGVARRMLLECSQTDATHLVGLAVGSAVEALDEPAEGMLLYVIGRLLAETGTSWKLRALLRDHDALLAAIRGMDVRAYDMEIRLDPHILRVRALVEAPSRGRDLDIEWKGDLALNPGDVVLLATTDRWQVREHVTLRAAGRVVADGECVDVDGEPGVRIARVMR
jgi:Type III flagellar switch regulator (C-ring) FliN C-term